LRPLRPLSIVPLSFLGFPAQSGRESRPGRFSWQEESESWAVESCARLCKTVNPPRGCRDLAIHTRTLVIESPGEKRRVSSSESAKQKPALERRKTRRLAAGSNKRQAPDFRETFLRSVSYLYRKAGTVLSGDLSQNPGGQRRRPAGAQAPARRQSAMFSANRGLAMKTALISAMVLALSYPYGRRLRAAPRRQSLHRQGVPQPPRTPSAGCMCG